MTALIAALHLAGGMGLGALYFGSLWWHARQFGQGELGRGGGIGALLAGSAARFALLGGALWAASLEGAMPLLATALGVLLARAAVMRRVRVLAA